MTFTKCWFLLSLILTVSLYVSAQSTDSNLPARLDTYLNVLHEEQGFSGELLVVQGGTTRFRGVVGRASHEHELALTQGAKYRIASITKTFTGTLIALAEQEGLLSVHDQVSDYLGDLSPKFSDITLRQLLTHTSGLPHHEGIED